MNSTILGTTRRCTKIVYSGELEGALLFRRQWSHMSDTCLVSVVSAEVSVRPNAQVVV